jgi:hypothetical protein
MKKIIGIFTVSILTIALLTGCGKAALTGSPQPSATAPAANTASAAAPAAPSPTIVADGAEENNMTVAGDWVYYLDINSKTMVNGYEEYFIHKQKQDGSEDTNLKIAGFKFDIIGDYIYVDVDSNDDGSFDHWKTARYNLDGTGKKDFDYTDMFRLYAGSKLYFTCFNDCTVYMADNAAESIVPLKVTIPDDATIKDQLKDVSTQVSLLSITKVEDGWINFVYEVADKEPDKDAALVYTGNYRISPDGSKVEKVDAGTYPDISL